MKYTSTIQSGFQAVQVDLDYDKPHHWRRSKPEWFIELMDAGNLMPVRNPKERYVMVKNAHGYMRAYETDWIVMNKSGLVFVMPHGLFKDGFKPDVSEHGKCLLGRP